MVDELTRMYFQYVNVFQKRCQLSASRTIKLRHDEAVDPDYASKYRNLSRVLFDLEDKILTEERKRLDISTVQIKK